ncbi:PAS domain S-box protein [Geobacter sp. SVR]|uniref:sensor histidine kinase n=1 Tax=Geobacter sp. SVR TaxID=2495594 RepID=UPI00143EFB71|nr:PAS domain-containing sensor histidine kinase [Geobacter sp. SVR]BCS54804.1 PAS domain-containing sensor histidine kinase [Geobacter sp. SVR]GCF86388.1 PAS domain-containing sensor histidine kinase [Geobacter sp. SVR]
MADKKQQDQESVVIPGAGAKAAVSDEQLRSMVQNVTNHALYIIDPEGRIISWNAGAERIIGYRADEIMGRHFSILFPKEDIRAGTPQRELKRALAHGRIEVEGWRVRKDGSRYWANVTSIPLLDEQGGVTGFGKIVRDATEQRNHDEQLHKSRNMFERLFEHAPDAVVVVDNRGTIRKVNLQVETIFGYQRDELIGHRVEKLIPARFHTIHRQHRKTYFADPRTRKMGAGLDLYGRTRNGDEVPVDIMLSPVETENGTWAFAVIRDVTQRKQDERAITELNDLLKRQVGQLAATNRELEAFSYSVSHDLRAPLRALDGISLALLEDYAEKLDKTGRDFLHRIRSAAQAMGELIDHLLTLSRLARTELLIERVDLSEMAHQVAEELRQQDPGRTVEFVITPDMIDSGDSNLLRVAITNLLGNAWKFTSKKDTARIEFGVQQDQEGKIYFVRDNGAGFNQAYAENLFKPFQRLHAVGEFPGTGIGLATVHRVISRHGGSIWAEGGDQGATFYFRLAAA